MVVADVGREVALGIGAEVVLFGCTEVALGVGAKVVPLVCTEVALDVASWKVVPVWALTLTLVVLAPVTVGGGQCSRGSQQSTLIW